MDDTGQQVNDNSRTINQVLFLTIKVNHNRQNNGRLTLHNAAPRTYLGASDSVLLSRTAALPWSKRLLMPAVELLDRARN